MAAKKKGGIKDSSVIQRLISAQAPGAGKAEEKPAQKMFYMSPEEHKWLKKLSIEQGKSMSGLLAEGLRGHIFIKYAAELERAQKG